MGVTLLRVPLHRMAHAADLAGGSPAHLGQLPFEVHPAMSLLYSFLSTKHAFRETYERGEREPSLRHLRELLVAVAHPTRH